jgi:uncharacterized glyoxalase superfamily protein PhnB
MQVRKMTTVVVVDAIEPALPFWMGLGFAAVAEVPHGERLGFVILAKEGAELMLQTKDSVREDLGGEPPALALYCEVDTLEGARERGEVVIPDRTTFYGARETWVRDPAGTLVGFAVMPPR